MSDWCWPSGLPSSTCREDGFSQTAGVSAAIGFCLSQSTSSSVTAVWHDTLGKTLLTAVFFWMSRWAIIITYRQLSIKEPHLTLYKVADTTLQSSSVDIITASLFSLDVLCLPWHRTLTIECIRKCIFVKSPAMFAQKNSRYENNRGIIIGSTS